MRLKINGEHQTVPDHINISHLITHLGIMQHKLAVEVNRQIVPINQYDKTILANNDTVEIIHAVGGG